MGIQPMAVVARTMEVARMARAASYGARAALIQIMQEIPVKERARYTPMVDDSMVELRTTACYAATHAIRAV